MDSPLSGPSLRRRPSIHRSWNDINLTDDQKHTKMSESAEIQKPRRNSFVASHPERVSNVEREDSVDGSDQDSYVEKNDDDSSAETEPERSEYEEEHQEVPNTTNSFFGESENCNVSNKAELRAGHSRETPQARKDVILLGLIIFALISVLTACLNYDTKASFDLQSIKMGFPTQDDDLWIAFEAGVEDVVMRKRPSTFILLYEEEAGEILNDLVYKLSKFATCNITDCEKEPIEVTDTELNSAGVVRDYGTVIEKYRDKLEEKGVMIIKNLENVRGTSAQAFHSFCDEFTPLVQKSLFIFTMKVEELPRSEKMKFIEEYFRNKWTDIKIDAFNALITRITSMVLEIRT